MKRREFLKAIIAAGLTPYIPVDHAEIFQGLATRYKTSECTFVGPVQEGKSIWFISWGEESTSSATVKTFVY